MRLKCRCFCEIWVFLAVAAASPCANAVTIFSENFDGWTFSTSAGTRHTERYADGPLYRHFSDMGSWTQNTDPTEQVFGYQDPGNNSDQMAWLNETAGIENWIETTVTGLIPGSVHTFSIDHWGDNVPNKEYRFRVDIGSASHEFSRSAGNLFSGGFEDDDTFTFVPTSATATLRITETSPFDTSPIIDNIIITSDGVATSDNGGTMLLFGAALVGLGFVGISDRVRQAARAKAS